MKKLSIIGCALLLASSLIAADGYRYEVIPMEGKNIADHDSGLKDDAPMYGIRFNAYANDTLGLQLGYERSDDNEYFHGPGETDLQRFFANIILEGKQESNFTPYLLIGGGYEDLSNELDNEESQGFANIGLGFKYAVSQALDLVAEGRWIHKFDNSDRDAVASLGLGYKFGYVAQVPAGPAPEIIPEPPVTTTPKVQVKDSDGDGVLDTVDKCPNTPKGVIVDIDGCPKSYKIKVLFDFDKSDIKAEYIDDIEKVISILKKDPSYKAVIEGHTDSIGTKVYNQGLSERRANAVKNYIMSKGISGDRLRSVGYGEERPIATNKTREGRAQNRRVEAEFSSDAKK